MQSRLDISIKFSLTISNDPFLTSVQKYMIE